MMTRPYFLENKEWYIKTYNEDGDLRYELTDKAPAEAVKSYHEYYELVDDETTDY